MSPPFGTQAEGAAGAAEPDHVPVLVEEVLGALGLPGAACVLDGTVGAGGHAAAILGAVPDARYFGIDRDPVALGLAAARVPQATLARGSFADFERLHPGAGPFDGILLDLGVSSMQLDDPGRGFGFRAAGPLDMRMDPDGPLTAADLVRDLDEAELERLIREYGEERRARAVARALVAERDVAPIETVERLAGIVRRVVGRSGRIDPATRTFQALRIAVNGELDALESVLPRLAGALAEGGALAVISFHSLEDRIVKRAFRALVDAAGSPYALPFRKPRVAGPSEIARNRRARSAKLRVLRREGSAR